MGKAALPLELARRRIEYGELISTLDTIDGEPVIVNYFSISVTTREIEILIEGTDST